MSSSVDVVSSRSAMLLQRLAMMIPDLHVIEVRLGRSRWPSDGELRPIGPSRGNSSFVRKPHHSKSDRQGLTGRLCRMSCIAYVFAIERLRAIPVCPAVLSRPDTKSR